MLLALTLSVHLRLTDGVDRALLRLLSPSPTWLPMALGLTWLGDVGRRLLITGLVTAGLLFARHRRAALWIALVVTCGAAVNSMIKWIIARPRPDLLPRLDMVSGFSFPSGHAASAAMLYLALAFVVPARLRLPMLAFALLIGIGIGMSRVILAVHWPSDVLGGWLFGTGWVLLWRPMLRPRAG